MSPLRFKSEGYQFHRIYGIRFYTVYTYIHTIIRYKKRLNTVLANPTCNQCDSRKTHLHKIPMRAMRGPRNLNIYSDAAYARAFGSLSCTCTRMHAACACVHVRACMYVCVHCVCVRMCIRLCTYVWCVRCVIVPAYVCAYVGVYVRVCMRVRVSARAYVCVLARVCVCVCVRALCTCVRVYTAMYVRTCVRACVVYLCMCVCTRMCVDIRVCVRVRVCACERIKDTLRLGVLLFQERVSLPSCLSPLGALRGGFPGLSLFMLKIK